MSREDWIKTLIIPLILLMIAAIIKYYTSRPTSSELLVEDVISVRNNKNSNSFGYWALSPDENYTSPSTSEKDTDLQVLDFEKMQRSNIGIGFYRVHWLPSRKSIDALRSLDLKTFIKFAEQALKLINLRKYDLDTTKDISSYEEPSDLIGSITGAPTIRFVVRNKGNIDAVLYGYIAQPLYTYGGGCGAGGGPLSVANEQVSLEVRHTGDTKLMWSNPVIVEGGDEALIEVSPNMLSDSLTDCGGPLTYRLKLKYSFGNGTKLISLATFQQDDDNEAVLIFSEEYGLLGKDKIDEHYYEFFKSLEKSWTNDI